MIKRFAALALLPLTVSGCSLLTSGQLGQAVSQIGPAVGTIDDTVYSIAIAKYKSAQMFKAQIDGNLVLPPLPPPSPVPAPAPVPSPTPAPTPVPTPTPGGPIVTPNTMYR